MEELFLDLDIPWNQAFITSLRIHLTVCHAFVPETAQPLSCLRNIGKGSLRSSWRTGDFLPLALQGKRFLLVSVFYMLSL